RYFEDLKFLFLTCSIINQNLKKKHACRYIDINSCKLWESLPEHPSTSFRASHITVHKLYSGSEEDNRWSILDMDTFVSKQPHIGIFDSNNLGAYYRLFYNIMNFLHSKHRLSEAKQSQAFV
ncbi:hypothetical protein L208DRAFT_1301095, partial [Tricholoma matsutake]